MKRNDISGFSLNFLGYTLELVTVHGLPSVLALSKCVKTLWRIGD